MGAPQKKKHECDRCFYPLSTNNRTIPVITYVEGKRKMTREPCPKCNKK